MNHNTEICNQCIDYAISIYIKDGETIEQMLKKFNGDKIKLVNYLREREMGKIVEKKAVNEKPVLSIPQKNKTTAKVQETLF